MAEIFAAIDQGDVDEVRAAMRDDGQAVRERNDDGLSPIQLAAYRGRSDIVQALLEARPQLDPFEAATVGDLDRLRELVGADHALLRSFGPDGFTLLHLAAYFGHVEVARYLLDEGADAESITTNEMANQPLHAAVAHRDPEARLEIVRLLLQYEAPADVAQHGGFTPLHAAAQHGDRELAEVLVEHGADPTRRSDDGRTPADLAEAAGHDEVASWLRSW